MKRQPSHPNQLCLSIGTPLRVLIEDVLRTTRNPQLRKAAEQMLESLDTFELAHQIGLSKSVKANVAIQEILTK